MQRSRERCRSRLSTQDLSKAIKAVTKAAEKELKGNLLQGIQNLFKKK